ncbi:uncharacterized protein [Coffea arabica]|uniref:Uncharacterized protein isoform X2 n=1 Tax=Coffea arabica TaxID=13443 RepID=A0A6P6UNJ4_COFAR|nr:uncharacterized protein LOC113712717 isoform X2 [Coffea arabica]
MKGNTHSGMVASMRGAMDDSMIGVRDLKFLEKMKQGKKQFKELEDQQIAKAVTTKLPELYRAAMEGNWKDACSEFRSNQNAETAKISNLGMTALHVAASCGQSEFVQKLVGRLSEKEVEARDQLGRTALHHVALAAGVDAAKAMVNKNPNLPYLGDVNKHTPLFYAAKWRKPSESKNMVEYLYGVSREENLPRDLESERRDVCNAFTDNSGPDLIVAITASGSYVVPVDDEETKHEDSTSDGANSKNRCSAASFFKFMSKFIKGIREMSEVKQSHVLAVRLVKFVCDELHKKEKEEEEEKKKEKEKEEKEKEREKEKEQEKEPEKEQVEEPEKEPEKEIAKEPEKEKGKEKEKEKEMDFLLHFVIPEEEREKGKEEEKEMDFVQDFFIPENSTAILHLAVEHGVFELVEKCLKAFPDLIWYADKAPRSVPWRHAHYTSTVKGSLVWNDATQHADTATASSNPPEYTDTTSGHWKWHEGQYADTATGTGRLLLHVAIEHRRVKIFNHLIDYIGKNTKAYADLKLEGNNNSLHLAANLAPTPQLQSVPGPAFQMQRELQWFKAVEELVYDELKTEKNLDDKTPRELFFNEHKDLLKDAKEWMKDTSNSCMVVATLVATVAFAAMITVPGGNNSNTGLPILATKKLFVAFSVSNALSMVSSAVSLLMFLSIQTSRYTEGDFLDSLPKKLLRGLLSLFIAIATMMISFGTAIGLSLQTRLNWSYIPITIIACVPVIIFTWLQLPLLLQAIIVESGPGIFQGQRDRKLWCIKKIGGHLLAYDRV